MSPIKLSFRSRAAGLALSLLVTVPLSAQAAIVVIAPHQPEATPRAPEFHRHGPPGKRWIHRDPHPSPEPAVQRSIRPRQHGSPSMKARSWVHDETAERM